MDKWKSVIDRMEIIKDRSDELTLELLNYQYGYIGYCLEYNKKDEAKRYYSLAENNLETLEKGNREKSIINAYKSAFYGFRISFNAFSAPINGPRSLDYAKLALKQDSDNYLAYIQYANGYFNMPSAFGGSKKIALAFYQKARLILEKDPGQNQGDWNYLKLLTLIAQTYTELEDYNSAVKTYENILRIEPGFTYVRDEKYPELLKKK
ncbi:MAG TPA: hypothetical protein VMV47_10635 [Bacteroidales bacterium]|nr:hypothetical protein [Bacteroidales bacterium]